MEQVITGRAIILQSILDDVVHRSQGLSHRAIQALWVYLGRYTVSELRQLCSAHVKKDALRRELIYSIHRRRGYSIVFRKGN